MRPSQKNFSSARFERIASAIESAAAGVQAASNRPNSSPPRRPSVSVPRTDPRTVCATRRISSSPAGCPQVSLTILNWSRSRYSSADCSASSPPRLIASARRLSNSRRFTSPVSSSWVAWCSSAFSIKSARARIERDSSTPMARKSPEESAAVHSRTTVVIREAAPRAWLNSSSSGRNAKSICSICVSKAAWPEASSRFEVISSNS